MKAFIVDDEPLARDELAFLLKDTGHVEIAGEAENISEALTGLQKAGADVIFLDIQLAEETGLEIAKWINQLEKPPFIVFATAYDNYALTAFELNAADYILKPFDGDRVRQTIEKLEKLIIKEPIKQELNPRIINKPERLAISADDKILILNVKEIVYISALEGRTIIVTEKDRLETADPLISFEKKLQNPDIRKVHRSYLVNLDKVKAIEPWFNSTYNLILENGEKVPVSRTYAKEIKSILGF
ncbi:LytR/AlgR family response regulator transcription factor [Bacillus sp. EB01]|uniref:LytR/AlgR family response regulator transcription factor n=1 Tax=Bacillus sp. EB01 TaxID=1347086 RepID=UPI0005C5C246|nr:LytTR family transcriptional regulator DNA-binding domain-containing protein [Bacillus sp. EB01]